MAIGKEAPTPSIFAAAAASREALAAAVAELTETLASLPATTVKRRLRDAEIVLPFEHGFALENGFAAAADGFSPYAKIEGILPSKPIESVEGLEKK